MNREPDFIIVGAQRCGTTSLYDALCQHSRIISAARKEVHYFDVHYHKGPEWYLSMLPGLQYPGYLTGEASPYYLFHPVAMERLAAFAPNTKIIILLRDPTKRAISHYRHVRRLQREHLDFEDALQIEDLRLSGEEDKLKKDSRYYSLHHSDFSYTARGDYASQIKRVLEHFPANQVLLLQSELLFQKSPTILPEIQAFLGARNERLTLEKKNQTGNRQDLDEETDNFLRDRFKASNRELLDLIRNALRPGGSKVFFDPTLWPENETPSAMVQSSARPATNPIIIIGMHRSGTSQVSRMLRELGVFMGADLQQDEESRLFIELNERIFRDAGATWDEPEPVAGFLSVPERVQQYADEFREILSSSGASRFLGQTRSPSDGVWALTTPWGFKDPRTSYTLPVWLKVFPDARVIHVRRNGFDVAESLRTRHRTVIQTFKRLNGRAPPAVGTYHLGNVGFTNRCGTLEGAFGLWQEYLQAIERWLSRYNISALDLRIEDFGVRPDELFADLLQFCGLTPDEANAEDAKALIRPEEYYKYRHKEHLTRFANAQQGKELFGYEAPANGQSGADAGENGSLLLHAMTLKPIGAVNDLRVLQPFSVLTKRKGIRSVIEEGFASLAYGRRFGQKIFLWHRPILKRQHVETIQKIRDAGYVIVVEFDDHPMRWPEIGQYDYLTFQGAHAVQTSTEPLADYLRAFNPHVKVFPNQVAELPPLREAEPGAETPLTIFFGALNRESDWAPIIEPLNEVIQAAAQPLHFVVIHDRAFFDQLALREGDTKEFTDTCDYGTYRQHLYRSDVSLLPLQDSEFNRMKSDLKLVEAAAHGAVPVASPTVYAETLHSEEAATIRNERGEFAEVFHDGPGFRRCLSALISEPRRLQEMRKNGYEYVRRFRMLDDHAASRLEWYLALVEDRDRLDRELEARLDAMGYRP